MPLPTLLKLRSGLTIVNPTIVSGDGVGRGGLSRGYGEGVAPVAGGDMPVFNAGTDTLVVEHDFMGSVPTLADMFATGGASNAMWPADNPSGAHGQSIITSGTYNGAAYALRSDYPGPNESNSWKCGAVGVQVGDASTIHVCEYYAKITFATPWSENDDLGLKWFMMRHSSDRLQWHCHNGNTNPPCAFHQSGIPHTVWQAMEKSQFVDCNSWAPIPPRIEQIESDGEYHHFVHRYRNNTSVGSRDGMAQMWLNGTKIVSCHIDDVDVIPDGATRDKPYCTLDELDAIADDDPINELEWWSALTTSPPDFTVDIGYVRRWRQDGT